MSVVADRRLKRPRDPLALAKLIGDIATGQVKDEVPNTPKIARARKGGLRGGKARAIALKPEQRAEIARVAANARWKKSAPK